MPACSLATPPIQIRNELAAIAADRAAPARPRRRDGTEPAPAPLRVGEAVAWRRLPGRALVVAGA